MVFPKNCSGIWSFLYFSERWFFFFPKIWSYPLDGKWKMTFLKKIHGKMMFSSKRSEKMVFSKKLHRNMIFLVLSGKVGKWKMIFLKKYAEVRHFLYIQTWHHASLPKKKKNQRWSYRTKIHLKAIDILDWRSRKSSNNSLYFYGDLSYIAFQRKKQET